MKTFIKSFLHCAFTVLILNMLFIMTLVAPPFCLFLTVSSTFLFALLRPKKKVNVNDHKYKNLKEEIVLIVDWFPH